MQRAQSADASEYLVTNSDMGHATIEGLFNHSSNQSNKSKKWYAALAERLAHKERIRSVQHYEGTTPSLKPIVVVCVSDTHNFQPSVPNGHIFIHAGDLTENGTIQELETQLRWIQALPHQHKIVVAGNHDKILESLSPSQESETRPVMANEFWTRHVKEARITYLENSSHIVQISDGRSVKIYGSPYTSRTKPEFAFQYSRGTDVWTNTIPDDADIVVTHCPPKLYQDCGQGDEFLLKELRRVRPRMAVYGHVHMAKGRSVLVHGPAARAWDAIRLGKGGFAQLVRAWFIGWSGRESSGHCSLTQLANVVISRGNNITHKPTVVDMRKDIMGHEKP